MRTFVVFQPGTPLRCELMAMSMTAALMHGAELLGVPITGLRALQLYDFYARSFSFPLRNANVFPQAIHRHCSSHYLLLRQPNASQSTDVAF